MTSSSHSRTRSQAGRAAVPFADICIPSVFDDSLAPAGQHVVSMFTQWVPHTYADQTDEAALAAYADRVIGRMEAVAPGFASSVLHRQVIGPRQMQEQYGLVGGNIFHGELTLGQMFHARPAAGFADLRTPVRGCTRLARRRMAAAASPAFQDGTWCTRCSPTAGPPGGTAAAGRPELGLAPFPSGRRIVSTVRSARPARDRPRR